MAGTVDFNAYLFSRNAQPVGDHRLVFVQPADELKIEAVADSAVYKPGEDARIRFRVTNARGEGVRAAMGLQVIDEAVFALAEKQPGFAKVFFYLEQEVLKPRYEIHSIGMPEIVEPVETSKVDQRDRAARALFSATEIVSANKFETEFGGTVPSTKYADYANRYQTQFLAEVRRLAEKLSSAYVENPGSGDVARIAGKMARAGAPEMRDPWGAGLRVEPAEWDSQKTYYRVRSAGPDKEFDTGDDLEIYLEVHHRKIVGRPSSSPSSIGITIEPDRGPFGSTGEIVGTVVDQRGDVLEGATVSARKLSTRHLRTATVDARGNFGLRALPAGNYEVVVSMGAESVSRTKITIAPRDRAILAVLLQSKDAETVVVVNEAMRHHDQVQSRAQGWNRWAGAAGLAGGVFEDARHAQNMADG